MELRRPPRAHASHRRARAQRRAEDARRRAATYLLLARLVHEAPSPALLDELHAALCSSTSEEAEPLITEVLHLTVAVDAARSGIPPEVELRVEHARLWEPISQGDGPAPPYESAFREQRLPGDATAAVAACYDAAGLQKALEGAGHADHLASELRFVALCAMREAEAWAGGRDAEAIEWHDRQREFLDEHLLAWVPDHCSNVARMAQTEYHRAVANLVAGACRLEASEPGPG